MPNLNGQAVAILKNREVHFHFNFPSLIKIKRVLPVWSSMVTASYFGHPKIALDCISLHFKLIKYEFLL